MPDRIITRSVLNDWILNDGLEHLFAEGYLSAEVIGQSDVTLRGLVAVAHDYWRAYSSCARAIEELVG